MTYKSLGFLIRSFRLKRKASLRQFATLLGIHYSTLQRIETGQKSPSQTVMKRLLIISGAQTYQELVHMALH